MKTLLFIFIPGILLLVSCYESKHSTGGVRYEKKLELTIYKSVWSTHTEIFPKSMVGHVNLFIQGKTNAERLTVRTIGDGHGGDLVIRIDSAGTFIDTVEISFTFFGSVPDHPVDVGPKHTTLKAYLGSEVFDTILTSGPLQY